MYLIQLDDVREALDTAISGRICSEAWLGYANLLFLGFDFADELLSSELNGEPDDNRSLYLLGTDFADWVIENDAGVVGTADDERAKAESAARLLYGVRATGWSFIGDSLGLSVEFESGLKVRITPMSNTEEDVLHKGAWQLRMPDGHYRHARWDGTLYALHKDEPASLEPTPLQ